MSDYGFHAFLAVTILAVTIIIMLVAIGLFLSGQQGKILDAIADIPTTECEQAP